MSFLKENVKTLDKQIYKTYHSSFIILQAHVSYFIRTGKSKVQITMCTFSLLLKLVLSINGNQISIQFLIEYAFSHLI